MRDLKAKFIIVVIFLLLLVSAVAPLALADTQATISTTVVPELISVYVNRPQIAYGTVALGQSDIMPPGDPVTNVKNNGTVTENLIIFGTDATSATGTWVLDSSVGTDKFVHKIQRTVGDTALYSLSKTTSHPLASNLATDSSVDIKLRISTPTSITGGYEQYATSVNILAVKS